MFDEGCLIDGYVALADRVEAAETALREACLHQGLPIDAPPERIATHFRNNREYREGFAALSSPPPTAK